MEHELPGHWPEHARRLYEYLAAIYGEDDALPVLTGEWVAYQRSAHTQRAYARCFKNFEEFAREHGTHPMTLTSEQAAGFRSYLETAPTWRWVAGGHQERNGEPYSKASRTAVLSAVTSVFDYYRSKIDDGTLTNPFRPVEPADRRRAGSTTPPDLARRRTPARRRL